MRERVQKSDPTPSVSDDDLAKVVRKLRQSTAADALIADNRYFARLVEEIAQPLPKLPDTATAHEAYLHVRLENLRAHALRLLGLVA